MDWNSILGDGVIITLLGVIYAGISGRLRRVEEGSKDVGERVSRLEGVVDTAINGKK